MGIIRIAGLVRFAWWRKGPSCSLSSSHSYATSCPYTHDHVVEIMDEATNYICCKRSPMKNEKQWWWSLHRHAALNLATAAVHHELMLPGDCGMQKLDFYCHQVLCCFITIRSPAVCVCVYNSSMFLPVLDLSSLLYVRLIRLRLQFPFMLFLFYARSNKFA